MLHAKYESSSPYGLGQEDFLKFPSLSLCINRESTTKDLFPLQGYNLKYFDRGPPGDATCQI